MRTFPSPQSHQEVLNHLKALRKFDRSTSDGRTFGHIFVLEECTQKLAKQVFSDFLTESSLAFHIFPSLLSLEREIVGWMLTHLNAPAEARGTFTSGGTESIILAIKACRDQARADGFSQRNELLLPITAHPAFQKGAQLLDLTIRWVDVNPDTLKATPESYRQHLSEKTLLLVCSAPSYSHGAMDPIEEVAELAHAHGRFLHVDACMGGFLLPFVEQWGQPVPLFDFRLKGVTSISVDLHKYAFAPKGASVLLCRNASLRRHHLFTSGEWTGYPLVNQTIQSSRSAGAMAATWAVISTVGKEGYEDVFQRLIKATNELFEGLLSIDGISVRVKPIMPLLAFETTDGTSVFRLTDALERRGWFVQPQLSFQDIPPSIHLTILPNQLHRTAEFLADVEAALLEVRANPNATGSTDDWGQGASAILGELMANPDANEKWSAFIQQAMAQTENDKAGLNEALERLPRPVVTLLLSHYLNELLS